MAPLVVFAIGGVVGWAAENLLFGPRYSKAFGGARVPLLPVYGAGAALIVAMAPALAPLPLLGRFVIYTIGLSAIEAIACLLDRVMPGQPSWSYEGVCIDGRHALLWGLAGTALGGLV